MKSNKLTFKHRFICAMPYEFLHFLIEYRCFEQFVRNASDSTADGKDEYFLMVMKEGNINPVNLFEYPFVWEKTPEGYNFWYRRSLWWRDYLLNLIK